jgi:hypothetical protein
MRKKSFLENSRKRNLLKIVFLLSLSLCLTGCGNNSKSDKSLTSLLEDTEEDTEADTEETETLEDTEEAENDGDTEESEDGLKVIDMYEKDTEWSESDYTDIDLVKGLTFKVRQEDIDNAEFVNVSRISDWHQPIDYLKGWYSDNGQTTALSLEDRTVSVPYIEAGVDNYVIAGTDRVYIGKRGVDLGYSLYYANDKDSVNEILENLNIEEVSDITLNSDDYTLSDNCLKANVNFTYLGVTVSGGVAIIETDDCQYVFITGGDITEEEVEYMLNNVKADGESGGSIDSYYETKTLSIDLNNKKITFDMPDIYYMEEALEEDVNKRGKSRYAEYWMFGSEYINSFLEYEVINAGKNVENTTTLAGLIFMSDDYDYTLLTDVGTLKDADGDEWHKYTWDNSRYDTVLYNGVGYVMVRNKHVYFFYCEYGDYDVTKDLEAMINTITVSVGESGDTNNLYADEILISDLYD